MESQLHQRVRHFQFSYWFSFTDALQVFGEMRKLERISVGSVTWASLKHFSKQVPAAAEEPPAPVADVVEEPPVPVADVVQEPPVPIIDVGDGDQSDQDDDTEVLCDFSENEMPNEIFFERRRVRQLS